MCVFTSRQALGNALRLGDPEGVFARLGDCSGCRGREAADAMAEHGAGRALVAPYLQPVAPFYQLVSAEVSELKEAVAAPPDAFGVA